MELCNEPDCGKRFSNKELTQEVSEERKSNPPGRRVGKWGLWLLVKEVLRPTEYEAQTFLGWGRREAIAGSVLCCHGPGDPESPGILGEEQV
jgi:hypothetical protein